MGILYDQAFPFDRILLYPRRGSAEGPAKIYKYGQMGIDQTFDRAKFESAFSLYVL